MVGGELFGDALSGAGVLRANRTDDTTNNDTNNSDTNDTNNNGTNDNNGTRAKHGEVDRNEEGRNGS